MYRTFLKPQANPSGQMLSTLAKKGLNQEGLPEMMNLDYAKKIVNYIPYSYGIAVRKGLERVAEKTGLTSGPTLFKYFTNGNFILAYGTTVEAYNINTDTFTTIKNDFTTSTSWGGDRYGEYFFVTNGIEKPYRIDNTLSETEVTNAPICKDITFIGPRAVAISLSTDETAVQISEVDDTSNPPFDAWSIGTNLDEGDVINYRNASTARSCVPLGNTFVVFCDDGYYAFTIAELDLGGTLSKSINVVDYIKDFGGARGAISTPKGVFYLNEAGLWLLAQVGQTYVPYSRQQKLSSVLLTDEYFDNVTFSNVDLAYDEVRKLVLVSYAQGSSVNNKVLAYKTSEEIEALFEIEGWALNRFAKYNGELYAVSSVDGKLFKCFEGWTDDGLAIGVEYAQEMPLESLWAKHALEEFYAKGFLSIDSVINVNFDIYDKDGTPIESKKVNQWTPQRNDNEYDGWGTAKWGESSWGGDYDLSQMVESFDGCAPKIKNLQRLTVRFTSNVTEPHIISWFSAKIVSKAPIRRRKMTKIT